MVQVVSLACQFLNLRIISCIPEILAEDVLHHVGASLF